MAGSYNTATETCPKISFFFFPFESVNLSTFYKGRWHECHLGLFGGQFCEHFSKNTSGLSVQACVAHILRTSLQLTGTHSTTMLCGSLHTVFGFAYSVGQDTQVSQILCNNSTGPGNMCRFGLLLSAESSQLMLHIPISFRAEPDRKPPCGVLGRRDCVTSVIATIEKAQCKMMLTLPDKGCRKYHWLSRCVHLLR